MDWNGLFTDKCSVFSSGYFQILLASCNITETSGKWSEGLPAVSRRYLSKIHGFLRIRYNLALRYRFLACKFNE